MIWPYIRAINIFEAFTLRYGVRRTHYFSSNSQIPRIDNFGLIWDYLKLSKQLVLSIEDNNMTLDSDRTIKTKVLKFGDHGLQKWNWGLFVAIYENLQCFKIFQRTFALLIKWSRINIFGTANNSDTFRKVNANKSTVFKHNRNSNNV